MLTGAMDRQFSDPIINNIADEYLSTATTALEVLWCKYKY